MKSVGSFIAFAVLTSSTLSFAEARTEKEKQCDEIWEKLELAISDKSSDGKNKKRDWRAATKFSNQFRSEACDRDNAKERTLSQIRAEMYLLDLEEASGVKADHKVSGKYAHSTTECLLLDYQKEASAMKDGFKTPVFKSLAESDVSAYNTRLDNLNKHISGVLSQLRTIPENKCVQAAETYIDNFDVSNPKKSESNVLFNEVNGLVEKVKKTEKISISNRMKLDNRIIELQDELRKEVDIETRTEEACKKLGATTISGSANAMCYSEMNMMLILQVQEKIKLLNELKTELTK